MFCPTDECKFTVDDQQLQVGFVGVENSFFFLMCFILYFMFYIGYMIFISLFTHFIPSKAILSLRRNGLGGVNLLFSLVIWLLVPFLISFALTLFIITYLCVCIIIFVSKPIYSHLFFYSDVFISFSALHVT